MKNDLKMEKCSKNVKKCFKNLKSLKNAKKMQNKSFIFKFSDV